MPTNFRFNNGGTITDFSDVFIRRDIFSKGGLWTWGSNSNGNLGDGTTAKKSSPVQTVSGGASWKQVSGSGYNSGNMAGIKTDGTLWLWGYGAIGDNGGPPTSSPVQTVAGGTNWKQVSTANDVAGAIKTDGTLWMWGRNYEGAMGDGTNSGAFSPQLSPVQTIAGGAIWKQVSANTTVGAIKTDGTLWMWGDNFYGQLGDNTRTLRSSPVQTVSGGTNWKQVSTNGSGYSGAVKTDGTLWMWGTNGSGQLGDNTRTATSSPIQTVAGGTNWKQVYAGGSTTAAIKTDGTLWLWGSNTGFGPGQLGDGTILAKSSPVQTVAGGTNWKQVSGNYAMAAIKTDGTLWTWGDNSHGQLGDGTTTAKSSPIQTLAGGTNWKQVTMNGYAGAISEVFGDGSAPTTEVLSQSQVNFPSSVTYYATEAGGGGYSEIDVALLTTNNTIHADYWPDNTEPPRYDFSNGNISWLPSGVDPTLYRIRPVSYITSWDNYQPGPVYIFGDLKTMGTNGSLSNTWSNISGYINIINLPYGAWTGPPSDFMVIVYFDIGLISEALWTRITINLTP